LKSFYAFYIFNLHSIRASLNLWQSDRSDWVWAQQKKSLISAAQGPVISVVVGVVVDEAAIVYVCS
jgi:hypothetical protein